VTQLVLQPDASAGFDTYILGGTYAEVNFGDDAVLNAGATRVGKVTLFSRPLLRFDLTAIPAGMLITSATLTLFHAGGTLPSGGEFRLHRLTRENWTEFGATWDRYNGTQSWTTPGGDFVGTPHDTVTIASQNENLVFASLAAPVADALANHQGLLHLAVLGPEFGTTDNYLSLHSSDGATASLRPKLVVEYELPVPQLVIVDHGDDTGATATIDGTLSGSANTVYVQAFDGQLGSGAWTVAATRSGNGTAPLSLPRGHYFAHVHTAVGELQSVSAVAYFVVSDGVESIHTRCLAAAQARIRLLGLDGLAGDSVVVEKVPAGRNLATLVGLPAIVLSPHRAAMPAVEGTNSLDDVFYDVLVAIFDRDNQESTLQANLGRHMLWRQQIARAFRNQRLSGVPEVINCGVEPAEGLLEEAWKRELMTSAVLLRFTSRETRGFN
jgi:hypothetical protein